MLHLNQPSAGRRKIGHWLRAGEILSYRKRYDTRAASGWRRWQQSFGCFGYVMWVAFVTVQYQKARCIINRVFECIWIVAQLWAFPCGFSLAFSGCLVSPCYPSYEHKLDRMAGWWPGAFLRCDSCMKMSIQTPKRAAGLGKALPDLGHSLENVWEMVAKPEAMN